MLNMLIIDDEPIIADGLSLLVETNYADGIRIHRAYTTDAALQHCSRVKIDIVLSDVLMPEMNGLQLQERIQKLWDQCQFIFITGHDDFPYIQQALRNGTVSYILKTEGDEAVLAAIDRAIERINRMYQTEKILLEAETYRQEALPLLRNQLFLRWLRDDWGSDAETAEELEALDFPLNCMQNILSVWIQFSGSKQHGFPQRLEPSFVMRSVTQAILGNVQHMDFQLGIGWQVYLFQGEDHFEKKVLGSLEQLQELFFQQTNQHVSIIATRQAEPWKNLSHIFRRVERVARQNADRHYVYLLDIHDNHASFFDEKNVLDEMRQSLADRHSTSFFENFDKLCSELNKFHSERIVERRVSHTLQLIAMASEACTEIDEVSPPDPASCFKTVNDLILQPDTWKTCIEQLRALFLQLFTVLEEDRDLRAHQLIMKLHTFINDHLNEDLSLTRLGEVMGYNASYLSSVYRRLTGQSLVDHINHTRLDHACQLLADPTLRIRQVALDCGFESQQYFNRCFKKKWGVTPNEYRNKTLNLQSQ